jgi:hypothetical protein
MRLKSEIWVQAYLRICSSAGSFGAVVKRGDADAGAIYVRISYLDGRSALYGPAIAGLDGTESERRFQSCLKSLPASDADVEDYLRKQRGYDPDLWIVEIEDRAGRHHLGDWLVPP